jgi:diguanylate cyclase (GGDEF)-like protein
VLDAKLIDESARLAALRRYDVLDTPAEEPFEKITALVGAILKTPICTVTLVDAERQWFKSHPGIQVSETPRSISFCTHTITRREPLIIEDARKDQRFWDNPLVRGAPFIASYAGVPLKTPDGYNVGALCVIDTVARKFEAAQIEILKSFAALVVDELELRQLAQRDFLTGVMSRRAFMGEIDRQMALCTRHDRTSSIIMFDVDHFKSVNDRFGHPAGDMVLKEIAGRVSAELRVEDCIGRLGGEEFAVLLPDTSAEKALNFAERLRTSLAACPMPLDVPVQVTASFGIAEFTCDMKEAVEWLSPADAALYSAKKGGRDRCVEAAQNGSGDRRKIA